MYKNSQRVFGIFQKPTQKAVFEGIYGSSSKSANNGQNIERAIENPKGRGLLDPHSLAKAAIKSVEVLVQTTPSSMYKNKPPLSWFRKQRLFVMNLKFKRKALYPDIWTLHFPLSWPFVLLIEDFYGILLWNKKTLDTYPLY